MPRIAFLCLLTLLCSFSATAEPWWAQISLATTASNAPKVVAAADAFMASEIGQTFPGRLMLQANLADGANPNTHSFVPIYRSAADRDAFVGSLQGDPAWAEFQGKLEQLSQPGGTVQYRNVKSWGDINDTDDTWMTHALAVSDAAAYLAAVDALMASPTGQKFPGQVYLSAVVAGGISPVTHVVSVGYDSVQEMAAWLAVRDPSADWAAFQRATQGASEHLGASLGGTVKTWGQASMQEVVAPSPGARSTPFVEAPRCRAPAAPGSGAGPGGRRYPTAGRRLRPVMEVLNCTTTPVLRSSCSPPLSSPRPPRHSP